MSSPERHGSGGASGAEAPHASVAADATAATDAEASPEEAQVTDRTPPLEPPDPSVAVPADAPPPAEAPPGDDAPPADDAASADEGSAPADGGPGPGGGHAGDANGAEVHGDLRELAAKAQKADEYLELAQRTKADFENYRKRAAREAAVAQERGVVKLARELLPAVDSLDRALDAAKAASNNGDDLASGIKLVHAEVLAALARVGVEPFSPEGEPFDPEHHEAVAQQPVDGAQPGTCVEVYQPGYRLRDTVIRPAKVLVAG